MTGLTVAASTDGAPFSEIDELQWCVFLENGEATVIYTVDGLTTERALARISAQGVGAIPVPAVTPLICGDDAGGFGGRVGVLWRVGW